MLAPDRAWCCRIEKKNSTAALPNLPAGLEPPVARRQQADGVGVAGHVPRSQRRSVGSRPARHRVAFPGPPAADVSGHRWSCGTVRYFPAELSLRLDVTNGLRYALEVLRSLRDKETEAVWRRQPARKCDANTQRIALRKLLILDAADTLGDLRVPPGNRLEKLKGDRAGSYSIRVNQQWRICFRWSPAGPEEIEIVDYH